MSRTFFDSSAWLKRYIEEVGSETVDAYCRDTDEVGLSVLCLPETLSALNRKVREKVLPVNLYQLLKDNIVGELEDTDIIDLHPDVLVRSIDLLEANQLRTLDALQIGCALVWQADLFVTADRRQLEAARQAGLEVGLVEA